MEARLTEILQEKFQTGLEQATNEQVYYALLTLTKERIKEGPKNEGKRKLYYISAEFLIGKLLSNNLINLGIYDETAEVLKKHGKNLAEIEEVEPEPSLEMVDLDDWQPASWIPLQHSDFGRRNRIELSYGSVQTGIYRSQTG